MNIKWDSYFGYPNHALTPYIPPFSFAFFLIPLVFWVFLSKKKVHVLSKFVSFLALFCWLVFKKIFVLFLGLGQEAQQVMCGAWGNKHIYQTFSGHLICISFSNLFFVFFFFFIPLVFWVFWHFTYIWHGLSQFPLLFVNWFF